MFNYKIKTFLQKIKKTCKSQFVIHDQQINSTEKKQTLSKFPPLIAKLKPTTKIQNDKQSESDGNYLVLIINSLTIKV